MTPELLQPLHTAILWAHHCPDPLLWDEAVRRFEAIDRALVALPGEARGDVEDALFRMLPVDWPLWVECCRRDAAAEPRPPPAAPVWGAA